MSLTFPLVGYRYGNCVGSHLFTVRAMYTGIVWGTAVYFLSGSQFALNNTIIARRRAAVEVRPDYHCVRYVLQTLGLLFEWWTTAERKLMFKLLFLGVS